VTPGIAPAFERIAREFYDRVREHEGAHAVFTSEEQVRQLQASLVVGMLAFHIPEDQALAAGLALQAVQVLPVIAIGIALVGAQGLRSFASKRAESVGTA